MCVQVALVHMAAVVVGSAAKFSTQIFHTQKTMTLGLILLGVGIYLLLMLFLGALFIGGIYLARRPAGQLNSSRRAFLGGSNDESHALFFGVQLVIQIFGSDDLRQKLHRLVQADETSAADKRRFLKSVASLLIENQYAWEYGFWDYRADAEEAISNFSQWSNEIEASMATEPDEMGESVDRLNRFNDNKEYLIVTLMMLIDNRDEPVEDDQGAYEFRPTYAQLAAKFKETIDSIPEPNYFRTSTFVMLLEAMRSLDPRGIERDGIYVYPGTAQDGLSSLDLIGDASWKYLTDHPLRFS